PYLILDTNHVATNAEQIRSAFPDVDIFYAMKCNPHPDILERLRSIDVGFEIASISELQQILRLGVSASRMACFHTIKSTEFLTQLNEHHVARLAVDCVEEVDRIADICPDAEIFVRLDTQTKHSRLLLNRKFGCSHEGSIDVMQHARNRGLTITGITMHVGSQCERLSDWQLAAEACRQLIEDALRRGFDLQTLSLGGGLPVHYNETVPTLQEIADCVLPEFALLRKDAGLRLMMEPGRRLVATAAILVASVISVARRGDESWVYLDAGVYHGLMEKLAICGGFVLPVQVERSDRPHVEYRLAGPTCDSIDVFPGSYRLPELHPGDQIAFHHAGAYSASISTSFNGFQGPEILTNPAIV
ncbi:MAG: type III PLP-dependent enzyme, partial [Planctomycetota bacterium]